jgi:acyl-CoA synthetase (AMP-forming)/AMP-acid ligase II
MENLVGVHAVSSVEFVKAAFDVYRSGDILVIIKPGNVDLSFKREIAPASGGGWLDLRQDIIDADRPAQIVFSSGTEGAPKAILLTHRALADVVVRLNRTMQVDASIREYVGVPVTYSFGLGRCRAVAAAGGRCFLPDQGFNPVEIARMLEAGEINAISAVPTLWRTILARPEVIGELGRRVKWIEIGSQFMSRDEKEQMKQLFPNAVIVQHYGLTEASRTALLVISDTSGERLDSVGRAVGDVEIGISEAGRIQIRGPHVASGQIVDGRITSLTDGEGWLTTSDLGRIDDGFLYYGGRADDVVNCGGVKVNPEILQQRINDRLGSGNQVAVCRIDDALRGDGFFIAIEQNGGIDPENVSRASLDELQGMGVDAKSAVKIQTVAAIPRTDTGKVQRKELSRLYLPADAAKGDEAGAAVAGSIRELFAQVFPGVVIRDDDTFRSLGGDSLNYVQMLMVLEKHLGFVPQDWDKAPISQLEAAKPRRTSAVIGWIESSIFLRVLAILGVVATHSGAEAFGGGTLLLFMLIGFNIARFKSEEFMAGRAWPWIAKYLAVILVPYYIFLLLFSVWNKTFYLDSLLLYTNLVEARILVVFPFWFIQVLLQCMLLLGIMFSVPWFRNKARAAPFQFSLLVLFILVSIRAAYPYFWHTKHLNDLVPLRFIAILWLGWCFHLSQNLGQRLVLAALGITLALLDRGLVLMAAWLTTGSLVLALLPRIPVISIMKPIINDIGAATYYIFVFNGLTIWAWQRFSGNENPLVAFCIAMLVSMVVWRIATVTIEKLKTARMFQEGWRLLARQRED